MNRNCFKTVFSKRLGAIVVVSELTGNASKAKGGFSGASGSATGLPFVGILSFVCAFVLAAFAAPVNSASASPAVAVSVPNKAVAAVTPIASIALSATALPTGGQVVQGAASISQSGAAMNINQSTAKAVVNWQSFDVGTAAKVTVAQPDAQSVLLSRVVGENPTQILGQLSANGQIVLVNPNGITFGKDGSVSAAGLTASTLGISDADFMAGKMNFSRDGSTAAVVNQGSLKAAPGGYIALLGATVSNEGTITVPQGNALLASAEKVTIPLSSTGKIKLELLPSTIQAMVDNHGVIVAEGGQVYMQASAIGDALAQVVQSGRIDVSGEQGGAVYLLADGGQIVVDGSITANSTGNDGQGRARKGGDIIIGRDEETGALAKSTDVSGAKLESNQGFVETSGDVLSTTGTRVKAGEWLLDPYNITIAAGAVTGTDYSNYTSSADSTILASDISANLTAGTSVTIATGAGGASAGNIAVNESIAKTGGGDATLTLQAHSNITVATNKTITSNTGKLNVVFNSDLDATNGGGIVFNSGSGITSNGGNITLGGGTALNGTGFAIADGSSTLQGISLNTATISAGGSNIVMNGLSPTTSASNVVGILMSGGTITTTGAGLITLTGKNQLTGTTGATGTGFSMSSGTITGGSAGAVTIEGNSSTSSATSINNKGAIINGTVTSTGGDISVTGTGGAAAQYDNGVDIGGSVLGVGSANVTITGTAASGSSGGNVGVTTSGTATVSSVNGNINITGTGGTGNGTTIRNHGVSVGSSNAIQSSGSGNVTVTGRAINSDTNFSQGVVIGGAGLRTNSGNIKVDGQTLQNYQVAVNVSAAVTATTGNVYIRSVNAGITNSAAGVISGNNVLIENTAGTIDANGVITPGAGGATTFAGQQARNGIDLNGSVTAANNLNIYGNQTNTEVGVSMSGATTTISGKNVTLYGKSSTGNGVLLSSATLSGQYINATGATNTGYTGFAWSGGKINTTGTTGTSTSSTVKGISAASTTASNGYGAFMMFASGATNAASGTTLTLAGEATTLSTGQNTKERGILVQGGYTLTASGDITLDGSAKSSDGISFGGTITMATVAGVTNKLTLKGTTAASSNSALSGVNFSGGITGNASTSSINIIGEAKNLSGTNYDNAVNTTGTITGSSANVNIQALYGKVSIDGAITGANISVDNTGGTIDATTGAITAGAGTSLYTNAVNINKALTATGNINVLGKVATTTHTGVNLTATAPITSSGASKTINVDSTGNIANAAAIKNTGSTGTDANINFTSTSGTITGAGAIGDTINKNASITFTQAGTSTYDGPINAKNFTKAGVGSLTLDSWLTTLTGGSKLTNISNAYTVQDGGILALISDLGTYPSYNPASVNVNNASTFTIGTGGNGFWVNTAFNFTEGLGGGTMNIGGNPIGNGSTTTNIFSTSGGATNIITGGFNSNGANSTLNLTPATSGTQLLDGSFAALNFTQSAQGGAGLFNGTTITMNGGGNVLATDKIGATNLNLNAGKLQIGNGGAETASTTPTLAVSNVNIASGATLTFNKSTSYTNTSAYTGAGSLVQGGSGVLTLTGNSGSFSGATTVNAGKTLAIGTGGSLGAAGSTLTLTDATSNLSFSNTSGTSTVASTISGLGTVTENGSGGTGVLAADNTYTGTTTVSAGTLQIGNGGTTGTLGAGAVTDNAALVFNRSNSMTVANVISGTGTLTQSGAGTSILSADNSYSGATTITAGTLQVGVGGTVGSLGTNTGAIANSGTLTINRSDTVSIANIISGTGSLTQAGAGTTQLTGTNTYSGTTTISAGTLQVGTGGATGTLGTSAVANSGTLTINRSDTVSIANIISGTGSLTQAGAGTTQLTGTNTYSGTTTISAGTLQVGNGGATGTLGTSAVVNNAALVFNRNATTDLTDAGAISGNGTLSQAGAGKTILTADNSYSGATSVSGGTLQIGNATTTGTLGTTSAVTLSNNTTLAFNRTANTTIDKTISGVGNVTANITGDLALTSNIALTGTNTINLTASGSITETAGSLAATKLYMTATNGGIGAVGNRIQSNVTNLSLSGGGNVFVTEANAVTVAGRTTANNGSIDIATTNGTMTVSGVNSINGITANGTGNITLSGNSNTGNGISINNVVTATNGNVSLTGTTSSTVNYNAGVFSQSTVAAKNITMLATSTSTTGSLLGYYGAGGVFNASQQLSLTGISNSFANGLYSYTGSYLSGTGMTLVGSSIGGQGMGFDRAVTVTNSTSGGINITGTASDSTKQAIGFQGVAITNGGGALAITANNGQIYSGTGDAAWGAAQTNTITNNGTGSVQVTAGNSSATNSGCIDGSVFNITQNTNAGVVVSTSGTGHVTSPKIINAGTGDIVVAAGSALAAGNGTGGQILTVANNTLTQTNVAPGKTYIYSGAAASTGVLSNLSTGFNTLYYQGTSQALNTGFNQSFDANHANDLSAPGGSVASTQVFFRSTTKPGFSMTLANASKAYGETDPTLTATNATLTNAYAGVGGNNTFSVASADVIAGLTGSRAAGENVGTYAYTLSASSFNTTLAAQPNLVIGKRDITLATITASNKTYSGTDAATITSGTFGNLYNNETLAISGAGTFSSKDVANGKTVTVADTTTLTKTNGTGN
jgi:autotransporter-associated beta strand protein